MNKGRGHQRVGTGPAFRAALLSCALIVLHAYAQAALGAADRHAGGADGIYLVCLLQLVRARLSRTEDRRLEVVVLRVAGPRPHFAGSPCGLPSPSTVASVTPIAVRSHSGPSALSFARSPGHRLSATSGFPGLILPVAAALSAPNLASPAPEPWTHLPTPMPTHQVPVSKDRFQLVPFCCSDIPFCLCKR